MMNQPAQGQTGARYRGLLILWGAQLVSQLFLYVVARVAVADREGGDRTLLVALAAAGLSVVGVSLVLKPALLARAARARRPDMVTSAYVIAFGLCEACALLGILARFVTGARESLYFFVASALGLLLHFPRRAHVEGAAGDAAQTFKTTF